MCLAASSCSGGKAQDYRAEAPDTLRTTFLPALDSLPGTWLLPPSKPTDTIARGLVLGADSTARTLGLPLVACSKWHLSDDGKFIVISMTLKRTPTDTAAVTLHDTCAFSIVADTLRLASRITGRKWASYVRRTAEPVPAAKKSLKKSK